MQTNFINAVTEADKQESSQLQKLRKACDDFEAIFTDQIFKTMRKTSFESELSEKSFGEEVFTEMLDSEISKVAAARNSGGVGDMLFEQMKKLLPAGADGGNNFPAGGIKSAAEPYGSALTEKMIRKGSGIDIAF